MTGKPWTPLELSAAAGAAALALDLLADRLDRFTDPAGGQLEPDLARRDALYRAVNDTRAAAHGLGQLALYYREGTP